MMQTKNGSSGLDKNTPWKHSNSLLGWSIPESKIESVRVLELSVVFLTW